MASKSAQDQWNMRLRARYKKRCMAAGHHAVCVPLWAACMHVRPWVACEVADALSQEAMTQAAAATAGVIRNTHAETMRSAGVPTLNSACKGVLYRLLYGAARAAVCMCIRLGTYVTDSDTVAEAREARVAPGNCSV